MTLRNRLRKLEKVTAPEPASGPLTVVLIETGPDRPIGRQSRVNSAGLPVLEIIYDPAESPGKLPSPPYKLVHGIDPIDLV